MSRSRDRDTLDRELKTTSYRGLLHKIQESAPFLRQFAAWGDVIAFMRRGTSDDTAKDEVLRPILLARQGTNEHLWNTVLFAIFLPGLESIHRRKRHWAEDQDELWGDVTWVFLEVVRRVDVDHRPARLVQRIINDTIHRLYEERQRKWKLSEREVVTDPGDLEALVGGMEDAGLIDVRLRETQDAAIRRLRSHCDQGHLNEADFFLLVGTFVYGKSLVDYAREVGLPYGVAKKRRQRAWTAVRRHEAGH